MANPIKKTDIYEGGDPFIDVVKSMEKMLQVGTELGKIGVNMKKLDLGKPQELKELNTEYEKLIIKEQELKVAQAELTVNTTKAAEARRQEKESIKSQATEFLKLQREYKKMSDAAKDLAIKEGEQSEAFKKAAASAKDLKVRLDSIRSAVGDYTNQVGNYKEAIKGAFKETGLFSAQIGKVKGGFESLKTGVNAVKPAFSTLKMAIASTGIGILVIAFGSLLTYFTQTNEGAKLLKVAMAAIGSVVDSVIKSFAAFGKGIYLLTTGKWSEAAKEFGNSWDIVANKMGKNITISADLEKASQKLAKAQREFSTQRIKDEGEIQRLMLAAREKDVDKQKRVDMLNKAREIEEKLTAKELEFAREELRIIVERNKMSPKKDMEAETEARNKLAQAEVDSANLKQKIANRESQLLLGLDQEKDRVEDRDRKRREEAEKNAEKALKAEEDRIKKEQKLLEDEAKQRTDLMAEELDLLNKRAELKRRQLEKENIQMQIDGAEKINILRKNGASEVDISNEIERQKQELEIKAAKDRLEIEQMKVDGLLEIDGEYDNLAQLDVDALIAEIEKLKKELELLQTKTPKKKEKENGLSDESKEAWNSMNDLAKATSDLTDSFARLADIRIKKIQEEIDKHNEKVSSLENDLEKEKELYEKGAANNYLILQKELSKEKELRDQDIAAQQEAQRKKAEMARATIILNQLVSTSQIVMSAANTLEQNSKLGPWGWVSGLAAVIAIIAGWASAIASIKSTKFEKGGTWVEGGKRHSEGGNIFNKELEQGERVVVFNRTATDHYGGLLEDMAYKANSLQLDPISLNFGKKFNMNVIAGSGISHKLVAINEKQLQEQKELTSIMKKQTQQISPNCFVDIHGNKTYII